MSGGNLTFGHSAPPANSIYMSYVADRYTMLLPIAESGAFQFLVNSPNAVVPCLYANQFNNVNLTLGGFITAPDGTTSSCQKLVADTTNNQHYIQGGFSVWRYNWPTFRVAGIWHAAEYTRICHQVIDYNSAGISNFGFDLAGGQVAYAQFTGTGNTIYSLKSQTITPLGGGFYLCIVDLLGIDPSAGYMSENGWSFRFVLDNGSGTAAPSLTFAGPSGPGSGLYGWKNSVLPMRAWRINSLTLNDDFNDPTLSNWDLTNSQLPGKDWYIQPGIWNGTNSPNNGGAWFASNPTSIVAQLSASGSILTINPIATATPINTVIIGGFCTYCNPAGGYPGMTPPCPDGRNRHGPGVGRGFRPPFMVEWRWSYDYPNASNSGSVVAPWMGCVEWMEYVAQNRFGQLGDPNGGEIDLTDFGATTPQPDLQSGGINYETGIGTSGPYSVGSYNETTLSFGTGPFHWGYSAWQANYVTGGNVYLGPVVVYSGGNPYYLNAPNTAVAPPSAPWTPFVWPTNSSNSPTHSPPFLLDWTQMQSQMQLVLPYDRETKDYGCWLSWFNGGFVRGAGWTPNLQPSISDNAFHSWFSTDQSHWYLQVTAQQGLSASVKTQYDYIRISQ